MRSMTGYGFASEAVGSLQISAEIQSVNRRGLEISLLLPREWQAWESQLAEKIRRHCHRGKINASIKANPSEGASGIHWEEAAVQDSLARLRTFFWKQELPWPPNADAIIRLITLHRSEPVAPVNDVVERAVTATLDAALREFARMRAAEGDSMKRDLVERLARMETLLAAIREHSGDTVERYRQLLFDRLRQANLDLDLNDERVLKELALFADRCDISEELTRLKSHFVQFGQALHDEASEVAVGRKLEFILQEIHREFNTIGSKANRIEISQAVIEAKNEIERVREQLQNVE